MLVVGMCPAGAGAGGGHQGAAGARCHKADLLQTNIPTMMAYFIRDPDRKTCCVAAVTSPRAGAGLQRPRFVTISWKEMYCKSLL